MKTPPKSSAKIYRDAAARIVELRNKFCCYALLGASAKWDSPEMNFLETVFKPACDEGLGWWQDGQREPRILALLLTAEIVERGGL